MTNAIEASGLVKRFGKTTALAGVDLVARQGTVLGVLGPNGAGKTTAVRILATLLRADDGQAQVCGYDVARQAYQVRQLIGLTGQYASVRSNRSSSSPALARDWRRDWPSSRPIMMRLLVPDSPSSTEAYWPVRPISWRT